ncbi:MAG: transcriptional repressor [Clostridia bacterium]|nr:transcriptional repressor [Clostridia bacterium]
MKNYHTQQRTLLLDYLHTHIDENLSTSDILEAMSGSGISKSAVYRNLASLEAEGRLHRISRPGDRRTYYQFVDEDECRGQIHISCIRCGKTVHASPNVCERLQKTLENEDSFEIDRSETVIYGICKECRK